MREGGGAAASAYGEAYFGGEGSGYSHGYEQEGQGRVLGKYSRGLMALYHPRRVLDVGCAKGFMVGAFIDMGSEAFGCDVSDFAISSAAPALRQRLFRVDVEKERLPFPDGDFDLVTSIQVLEHIQNHDGTLKEMRRVLRPGGVLFAEVPTPDNPGRDVTHVSLFARDRWEALFRRSGFRPLDSDILPYLRWTEEEAAAIPMGRVGRLLRMVGLRDRLLRISMNRKSERQYRRDNYQFHLEKIADRQ